jgi:transcription initiation factor TFIIIB Brf1 subunit/transcription initiation factor TFIIB
MRCACFDPITVSALGKTVCKQCGLVLTSHEVDQDLDARNRFADEGYAHPDSRVGMPIDSLLPNMSMRTCIGGRGLEASRQRLLNKHQKISLP